MVVERFRNADPMPIRERFLQHGRMLPDDGTYHSSWIDPEKSRCFQIMEAADARDLDPWIERWVDLVDFEVVHILSSAEYWATIAS